MNKNRTARSAAITIIGLIFLCALPALARDQNTPPGAARAPRAVSPGAHAKKDSLSADDFADLNLTAEQKAEIEKIHRETEANKKVVAMDEKLTADQKNAMLIGYTHMEYGRTFNVLSPEQQKKVRQRVLARRAADQAAQEKQPPRNQ